MTLHSLQSAWITLTRSLPRGATTRHGISNTIFGPSPGSSAETGRPAPSFREKNLQATSPHWVRMYSVTLGWAAAMYRRHTYPKGMILQDSFRHGKNLALYCIIISIQTITTI